MPAKKTATKSRVTDSNRHVLGGDARLIGSSTDELGNFIGERPENLEGCILNIMPGDLVNKTSPEVPVQFSWVDLGPGEYNRKFLVGAIRDGYEFCAYDEWDMSESFGRMMTKDAEGRIVTAGPEQSRSAPMWRPKELMLRQDERNRRYSAEVQKSQEDRIRETLEEGRRDGVLGWTTPEGEVAVSRAARLKR